MQIYHSCKFTEKAEDIMKKLHAQRNKRFGYNDNRSTESKNRWIGTAGEVTLNDWFKKSPWAGQAHSHFKLNETDDTDFDFGRLNIDVKVQGKVNPPNDFDHCYIYEEQYVRIMEAGITNALVFGFYHFPSRVCALIGFITLRDFDNNRTFYKAGDCRQKNGKYPLSTSEYSISVGYAMEKGILLPLDDLDRHR